MSRSKGGKERPTMCNGICYERFRHLPYMDISSSGESPFMVVTARACETRERAACRRAPERVLLFHARDANSRIVNITRGPRIHDGARGRRQQERKAQKAEAVTPHCSAKTAKAIPGGSARNRAKAASHLPQMAAQLGRLLYTPTRMVVALRGLSKLFLQKITSF